MSADSFNPSWLFFGAGLLTLAAGFLSESQQRKSNADLRKLVEANTTLMQEMAGQTGNQTRLQEMIELRQRLLEKSQPASRASIDEILAKVPELTADYRALRQDRASAGELRLAAYRASWEPLVRFVIGEFDRLVGEAAKREPGLALTKNDAFVVAGLGQAGGNSQMVRVATFRGVELRLYCVSARTDPGDSHDGNLTITVRVPDESNNYSNPLSLTLRVPDAAAGQPPAVPQTMSDEAIRGIIQGITDLLVVGKGR